MKTIFEMIRDGEIPSTKLYEDDLCFVILDINPVNLGHSLVISKVSAPTFSEVKKETLDHMMDVAIRLDKKMRAVLKADGTNIMINNSPASGQEVPHLHIHVIPRYKDDGKTPHFSKTSYTDGHMKEFGELLSL